MTAFVTSADGTRIAYDRYGEGPAVLLIGGAMQFRGFGGNVPALAEAVAAEGFGVAVYDRRGRGESVAPGPYRLADEIADLSALLTALGGSGALVGSSSGGAIALAAAAAGLPVTAVVGWEVPLDAENGTEGAQFLAGLRQRVDAGDADATIAYYMQDMPPEWLARARNGPAWPVMTAMSATLVPDAEALAWTQSAPHAELFAPIRVPVLALVGRSSLPLFPAAAAAIAAGVPDGRTGIVEGADHGWAVADMARALAEFLPR